VNDNINKGSTIAGPVNDNRHMDSTIVGSMNDNINMDSTIAGSMKFRTCCNRSTCSNYLCINFENIHLK
jgi:hypothetical protein